MNAKNETTPSNSGSTPMDPATLNYEVAKAELWNIVQQLEAGSVPLEQTLELWQRGEALASRCRSILESAAKQIEDQSANGTVADSL